MQSLESVVLLALVNAVLSGGMLLTFIATLVRLGRILERIDNQSKAIEDNRAQIEALWTEMRAIPRRQR